MHFIGFMPDTGIITEESALHFSFPLSSLCEKIARQKGNISHQQNFPASRLPG